MNIPLIELDPPRGIASSLPVDFTRPLSTRLRNVLVRWRGVEWSSYVNVTPSELDARRNAGRKCLTEFLTVAGESALAAATRESTLFIQDDVLVREDDMPRRARLASAAVAAETLASWGRDRGLTTLGPLLTELAGDADLPPDIAEVWTEVASVSLLDFASASPINTPIDELFDQLLACLDERQRAIFEARSIPSRGPTLQDLADILDITRERVRQIQEKAESRVSTQIAKAEFVPFRWRAHSLRVHLGDSTPMSSETYRSAVEVALMGSSDDRKPLLAQFLLRLAGYSERSGWMIHQDAAVIGSDVLEAEANEHGLIEASCAAELLSAAGVAPADHAAMLERIGGFRRFGDQIAVWRGSVVDKVVRVLAIRGSPTSPDELATVIGEGHSLRSLRNRLSDDSRLARVGKNQWALRDWGLNEYTGTADEIAEEIGRLGGAVSLALLAEELASRFGISQSSVRAYAQTARFVVEGGMVRLRAPGDGFRDSATIADTKGCFQDSPESVTFCIVVDKEVLRGSGRAIPVAVAGFLGLTPGTDRRFQATHAGEDAGTVALTWPLDSVVGPTLGSTRRVADRAEAADGDRLRLRFDRAEGRLDVVRIPANTELSNPLDRLSALTGLEALDNSNVFDRLAASIGVDSTQLRSQLDRRGDHHLIELLPVTIIDDDLQAALAELKDALAPSD